MAQAGVADSSRLCGFGPLTYPYNALTSGADLYLAGDVDGDGLDDLVFFYRSRNPGAPDEGDVLVAINHYPNGFAVAVKWHEWFCVGTEVPKVGDFNGDGKADIAAFTANTAANVYVALSTGTSFVGTGSQWHGSFCGEGQIPAVGDFNGDGRDDIASFHRGLLGPTAGDVDVALSTGSAFGAAAVWHPAFAPSTVLPDVGDFDGDGKDDIVAFYRDSFTGPSQGDVRVSLSNGSGFGETSVWHDWFCVGTQEPVVGDFNGDGCDDVACLVPGDGPVYVAVAGPLAFVGTGQRWHPSFGVGSRGQGAGRFTDDRNEDLFKVTLKDVTGHGNWLVSAVVAPAGGHAAPETGMLSSFGYNTLNGTGAPGGVSGTRPIVLALVQAPAGEGKTPLAQNRAHYEQVVFGPGHPNVAAYFAEQSSGALTMTKAIAVGPLTYPTVNSTPMDRGAWVKRYLGGLSTALFDFRDYDTNHDGLVDSRELGFVFIDNYTNDNAANRPSSETVHYPTGDLDVVTDDAHVSHMVSFMNFPHEMCHSMGAVDVYGGQSNNGSGLSLMSSTIRLYNPATDYLAFHLDPWHKMRFGWIQPVVYDIAQAGASALLDVAQVSGLPGHHPPVLLYDSRRDIHEYYLLEYRSNGYDNGLEVGGPSKRAGGYDMGCAGYGVATWFVQTQSNYLPVYQPVAIVPPHDKVLTSTCHALDLLGDNRIDMGPDEELQSTASGYDVLLVDALIVPTPTPRVRATRNDSVLLNSWHGDTALEWFNRADSGVRVRVSSGAVAREALSVQWDTHFAPYLTGQSAVSRNPGESLAVTGDLGVRAAGGADWMLIGVDGTAYPMNLDSWDAREASLRVPATVPRGEYRLLTRDATLQVESNSRSLSVRDPYSDWIATQYTLGEQILHRDWLLINADIDGDGLCNYAEFATGGSCKVPEPMATRPGTKRRTDGGKDYADLSWVQRTDRVVMRVSVWASNDLAEWRQIANTGGITTETIGTNLVRKTYSYQIKTGEAKVFFRFQYEKVNE